MAKDFRSLKERLNKRGSCWHSCLVLYTANNSWMNENYRSSCLILLIGLYRYFYSFAKGMTIFCQIVQTFATSSFIKASLANSQLLKIIKAIHDIAQWSPILSLKGSCIYSPQCKKILLRSQKTKTQWCQGSTSGKIVNEQETLKFCLEDNLNPAAF